MRLVNQRDIAAARCKLKRAVRRDVAARGNIEQRGRRNSDAARKIGGIGQAGGRGANADKDVGRNR